MKKILLICMFLSFCKAICQERFELTKMGFSMNSPEGWYEMKNEEILKNLE